MSTATCNPKFPAAKSHATLRARTKNDNTNGQELELLVDTGSSDMFVASEICKICDEVVTSRRHKPEATRPLLDLEAANARPLTCEDPACVGHCTPEEPDKKVKARFMFMYA